MFRKIHRRGALGAGGTARTTPLVGRRERRVLAAVERLERRMLLSGSDLTDVMSVPLERIQPANLSPSFTPSEIRQAYGLSGLQFGNVAANGAGETIAIIDFGNIPTIVSDVAAFNQLYGLPAFNVAGGPTFTVDDQGGTPINPASTTSTDPLFPPNAPLTSNQCIETPLDVEWAHTIAPEANVILFETVGGQNAAVPTAAATPGVSVVSMSYGGGEGSSELSTDSIFVTPAGHQGVTFLASSGDGGEPGIYPAYSPNVIAVGGTSLTIGNSGGYGGETAWGGSGGGVSQFESQPTYQDVLSSPFSTSQRTIPDVAWLADPNTGVNVYTSYAANAQNGGNPLFTFIGGTSLAAPMWGGLIAIINQGRAINGLGTLNGPTQTLPLLYNLPSNAFNDITAGFNGFNSGPGYDLTTGRGSPNVPTLVSDMASATNTYVYVDPNSPGPAHNGSSWANAYTSLTQALSVSVSGQEIIEVAQGTYTPGASPSDSFDLKDNVAIYGGYAGAANPTAAQNPNLYPTYLSGNLGGGQYSYNVVNGSETNSTAILAGFTIRAAQGGEDGGGFYDDDGSPQIADCSFINDTATDNGGAVYDVNGAAPTLAGCNFSFDSATYGGAIYDFGSSPSLISCVFLFDSATYGGALYELDSSPTMYGCSINSCTATTGAGMANTGGGTSRLTDCSFNGNTANQVGGGMDNDGVTTLLAACTFNGNSAPFGGGMYDLSANPTLVSCLFVGNVAPGSEVGGGMDNDSSNADLVNCTFTGNIAGVGGAMANLGSSPSLTNCILWNDSASQGSEIDDDNSTTSVSYSDVDGGYAGTGNINANPDFVSGSNQELEPDSRCINVGSNAPIEFADLDVGLTTDRAGLPRIADETVDMGAYESQTVYVQAGNFGAQDGNSWNTAYADLETALTVASRFVTNANSYDDVTVSVQILVAQGLYQPDQSSGSVYQLLDNVTLIGGYAGSSNPTAAADPALYPSVLNGDVIDFHVVTGSGTNSTAVLDGFTIDGGDANGLGGTNSGFGAGIINVSGSPTIENCTFQGNYADFGGGAIYNSDSSPTIIDCSFFQNHATSTSGAGGAIENFGSSNPTLVNCTFTANTAVQGGAIYDQNNSIAKLTNCIFWADTGGEIFNNSNDVDDSNAIVTYSDVDGGYPGAGNLNANPQFVSATNPQLTLVSPCINKGNNSAIAGVATDANGNPRIVDAIVDLGAYEYQGPFVLYVDQSATLGSDNGTSWANAFTTLRQALAVVPTGFTIEVAQGTYYPGFLITSNATFALVSGVTIQGGYATGGSSSPNPSANVTILDGYGYANHVVTGDGINGTAVLDGFTIENGDADGGGANDYGGGLFDGYGSPSIVDCTFTGNSATEGGAVYDENDSNPTFTNCTFTDNFATDQGGAMANDSGSFPLAYNCEFLGNLATFSGGAIYNSAADVFLLNCTFAQNSVFALAPGGAGGAMSNLDDSNPDLINCILYGDSAPSYPEIYSSGSTPTITYSDVEGAGVYFGTGNNNANPLFVSGTNLELQTGSPCITTGSLNPVFQIELADHLNTDLAGNPRIVGGTVGMGAFEYQGPTVLIYSQELPANVTSGVTTSPVIVDQEQNGSPVSDGSTVTLSVTGNPAGVTLSGNTATINSSGQAIFNNLKVTGTPGSYKLEATDGNDSPVVSGSFNLTAQANVTPSLIYLTPPPASVAADTVLPAVVVEVELNGGRDLDDNSSVSLEVNNVTIATVTAVQGLATFNGLEFTTTGNFLMGAYDDNYGDYGVASAGFTVTAPVVTTQLVFGPTPLPTSVQEGHAIAPAITVTEVPSSGTLNDNSSFVTLTFTSSSGGTLGGTLIEKVSGNIATFSNLTPSTPGTYEITASDGNDASAEFSITALAPAASKLVFSTISSFQVGLDVPVPPFTVSIENSSGSVIPSDDSSITVIVLIPNGGAYDPRTATEQAVNGVATFNDYFIGQGTTFTLQATDAADDLTGVSQPFTIIPGPAEYLNVYPELGIAAGISSSVFVQAQDILRNVATGDNSSLVISLDSAPAGGTLGGTLTSSFLAGNAAFDNLLFNKAGGYYLTVTDAADDLSYEFAISVSANPTPAQLTFVQEPSNTSTGYAIDPAVTVGVEDQFGNLILGDESGQITLSIASGTGGAALGGIITANVQNGIATFNNVSVNTAGTFTLTASDGSDTDATSTSFTVTAPATIYVDQNATGANDGQDWPDAFTNLQSALAIAINGDRIDVAEGDYSPGGEASDTFQLINGVTIQGGYQTGGFNSPNPSAYPTLLDGMDTNYNVVTADGTDYSAVLEGFTITNGNADGDGDNSYGGGLADDGGSPTIIDCIFTGNTAVDGGAAFFADEGSTSATLVNCLFYANTASQSGGAIFDAGASPTLTNCTFTANSAFKFGGAIENDSYSSPTLTNCILWNDAAGDSFNEISNDYVDFEFGSSNPIVTYGDVDGGYTGTGNIDADPTFVSPVSNNYQLQTTSPCINAGTNGAAALAIVNTDLAGNPRINDLIVDMGAYETQLSTITLYVDQNAIGSNNGLSWSNAYTSLQSALAAALPGNTIDVAQGDYSPGSDPTDTFQLLDLVTIQGGFPTGGASSPDPSAYPTILDGMENNYHVVTGDGTYSNAVLEGFTITNGNAYGYGDADSDYGGGMVNDGGSPTVINCIFTNNVAALDGGAVYNVDSSPTFVDCLFVANTATYYGGAIDDVGASPFFTNCTFTANVISSSYGSAIENDFLSSPTLTNCILWNDNGGIGTEIDTGLGYGLYETTVNNSDVGPAYQYVGGTGNIDADPQFVDPADSNYQLQPTSPCINVGDNDAPGLATVGTDLAGNPRIIDGVVDMGAYEAQSITVIWTGADDGINWSDPGNWSDDLVPTANDDVIVPEGFSEVDVDPGTFFVHSLNAESPIVIAGGSLTLGSASVIGPSLTFDGGGTLDVLNNELLIDYGTMPDPIAAIESALQTGYNGGAWNGSGIVSSTVAGENLSQRKLVYSVGYADGADGVVSGLSSGQIEILPTLAGDAKLQGNVGFGDFQIMAQYFGHAGGWDEGNFTYASAVDFGDFQLLAQDFGQTASLSAAAGNSAAQLGQFSANSQASSPEIRRTSPAAVIAATVVNPAVVSSDIALQPTDLDPAASIFDGLFQASSVNGLPMFSDVALDLA